MLSLHALSTKEMAKRIINNFKLLEDLGIPESNSTAINHFSIAFIAELWAVMLGSMLTAETLIYLEESKKAKK